MLERRKIKDIWINIILILAIIFTVMALIIVGYVTIFRWILPLIGIEIILQELPKAIQDIIIGIWCLSFIGFLFAYLRYMKGL